MTQRDRIIKYLKDFGKITSYEAYTDLGITQLGARIFELKNRGYSFKTQQKKTKNRYGENTYYLEYSLEGKNDN